MTNDVNMPANIQTMQKLIMSWVCSATGKKHRLNIALGPILVHQEIHTGKNR